ncbi:unnamed protein product [Moneuplotes crassus]|uniref:Major facilitator superfamily (MFS) profile domain-containing protein n=1 Tax=Euplotes crassus TaxID=5936 RepID=A0AAD1XDP1_EUPCR|nr:unnamed protein product [Moneuplotes crassus]
MDKLIWLLFTVNMLFQASTCIFAPFFPSIAKDERHVSSFLIGVCVSMNALSFVIASILYAHVKIKRRASMYLGLSLTVPAVAGFGLLYWVNNSTLFITIAIILRFIGGIGQGFLSTSSYAMASARYKDNLHEKVGLLESGNGVGFLVGPIAGGIIYQFTHFSVPFFIFGVLILILMFMLRNHLDEDLDSIPVKQEGDIKVGFRYLMKHKRIFFAALSQFFTLCVLTFGQPIFGERLQKDYSFSFALIGLCFAIPTLAYALTGPLLLKKFTRKFEFRTTIMIGFLILVAAGIFIGPSRVCKLPDTSAPMMIFGLYLLGTGVACTIIPIIPEMMETVEQNERAHDKVSAIFNIFGGFGQIISPPVAGALVDKVGFNYSLDFCAFSVLLFLILYFVFCDGVGALQLTVENFKENHEKELTTEQTEDDSLPGTESPSPANESDYDQNISSNLNESSMCREKTIVLDGEEDL